MWGREFPINTFCICWENWPLQNMTFFGTELISRCSEWNCLQLMKDGWILRCWVNLISWCNPSIAPITFGKKRPTFSNSEANSSNSDGFGHRMIWCKFAITASITTSVHLRNVSSYTPNSCDNGRKLLTNANKLIIIWLIYYFVCFLSRHKSSQLFGACKHILYPAE